MSPRPTQATARMSTPCRALCVTPQVLRSESDSCRIWRVTTDKFSATVNAELLREARARAGPRGLSAFVAEAIRHELDRASLRDLLDELADELGPPHEEMIAQAGELLDRHRPRRRKGAPAA